VKKEYLLKQFGLFLLYFKNERGNNMAKGRITKRVVDALQPRESDYVEWDGELTGFGVRVPRVGQKGLHRRLSDRWAKYPSSQSDHRRGWQDRNSKGRARKRQNIGRGRVWARPGGRIGQGAAELTVAKLCDLYLAEGCDTKKP